MSKSHDVVIAGAGVAGLVAARHLEDAGRDVVIFDGADAAGGRMRTDRYNGYLLDRGFQVLLTDYVELQRYLDMSALRLHRFKPGARIYYPGGTFDAVDPLRERKHILRALFSPIGNPIDKLKLLLLINELKKQEISDIFTDSSISTADYLKSCGFSDTITERFFRPFFGGIFLENDLQTSSRMFRFVLKMFSSGWAAIPEDGIEAVPLQLKSALRHTVFEFNTSVQQIIGARDLVLSDGRKINFRKLIIAAYPEKILPALAYENTRYRETTNLYFAAPKSPLQTPLIALNAYPDALINNYCVLSDIAPSYTSTEEALISVSIQRRHDLHDEALSTMVLSELGRISGINTESWKFLRRYTIRQALPVIDDIQYDMQPGSCKVLDNIYLAGDYLLNPSLDAAMRSGRRAAEAVLREN